MNKLSTVGLLALALGGCQQSEIRPDLPAAVVAAQGQIVRYDLTYDEHNQHPQGRWIVQLATPMRIKGWRNQEFTEVKVFTMPRSTRFRVGTTIRFTYKQVPQAQQTPWKTGYEWSSTQAYPPGYTPNPELVLAAVQARPVAH